VFYIFAGIAIASTVTFMVLSSTDQKKTEPLQVSQFFDKALSALRLWSDPRLWVLQCTNLAYGFAAGFMTGYVARQILSQALSSTFIGFAGAVSSALSSILSMVLAPAAAEFGKGPVLALGAACFLLIALLSLWADPKWGWGAIVFYVLFGAARAVHESTNRAIFADTFPGEKSPGAFANMYAFGMMASATANLLGATGAYSMEMYLMVAFATLIVPGYAMATNLSKRQ